MKNALPTMVFALLRHLCNQECYVNYSNVLRTVFRRTTYKNVINVYDINIMNLIAMYLHAVKSGPV